jgi:SET domain-containing protein
MMDAYNYIKNCVFVKLKPSNISGIGVFAIKDIVKDTLLFQLWEGETGFYPITQNQLSELNEELRQHIQDLFLFSSDFPKDTSIYVKLTNSCHWIYTNPYYFVNSGYYETKSNIDKNSMKSIRDIKKGEEILSNYQRYEKINKKII